MRGTVRVQSSETSNNETSNNESIFTQPISTHKPIQLGLCCLNTTLREQKPSVFASRKMIQKTIKTQGIEELKRRILLNLSDVLTMMRWNDEHGIRVFRLSSEMFPHKTNPNVENYDYEFAIPLLKQIGELSRQLDQRLTFHPGQFNVIGTPHEDKFQHTINDLSYHADVLDLMELDNDSVIVIHGGGLYGDKEAAKKRWCENFHKLPENVRERLVLENCEKIFSIKDCLEIADEINIPIVFDTHHFECYKLLHPDEEFEAPEKYIPIVLDTWLRRDIKPKFHVSEQGAGRCGHHSDYIEVIPEYLLDIPNNYGIDIDIMIEAKKKELAIQKLYQKYPQLCCLSTEVST